MKEELMAEFKAEMAKELRATWLRGYRDGLNAVRTVLKGLNNPDTDFIIDAMLDAIPEVAS